MTTPKPGQSVRGSTTGRPIMVALDLLGRRWALRIGWELRDGPHNFNQLQRRCDGISPSVLTQRLKEQLDFGNVARDASGAYALTDQGGELAAIMSQLEGWSQAAVRRWKRRGSPKR